MNPPDPVRQPGWRGTAYYDAECDFCTRLLARYGGPFRRAGFGFVPLQQVLHQEHPPLPEAEFRRELKLERADGTWLGGADACLAMATAVWWLRPFAWFGHLPGIRTALRAAYRRVAARRHCLAGRCAVSPGDRSDGSRAHES
ncbi:MAG: DUF393 domain-containing protein [Verrucomicrobiales bacterium]|nr:DUF393 domain-containing protein [Verrucomicrobiales bacterium]